MADDGMREKVGWDEINRIDGILDFLLGWQRIPCIGISELNMKDRVRTAMTAVRLYQRSLLAAEHHQAVANAHGNGNGNGQDHSHGNGNGAAHHLPEVVAWAEQHGY